MIVYYVQINTICLLILLALIKYIRDNKNVTSLRTRSFNLLVASAIVLCVSDMVAGTLRGQMFAGAHTILQIANILYCLSVAYIGYFWFLYINIRLGISASNFNKLRKLSSIPLVIITVLYFTNPFTHFFFTIDSNNLYSRENGIIVHWIVSFGYLVAATILIIKEMYDDSHKNDKADFIPFLLFMVFPLIAGVIQSFIYGISAMQCGVTISITIIVLRVLNEKILTDSLTGLNNRHAFKEYIYNKGDKEEYACTAFMIDINGFKTINDTYGHLTGDSALQQFAAILKDVCSEKSKHLFLCRYGGDEFVIIGKEMSDDDISTLVIMINDYLDSFNKKKQFNYQLSASIGYASENCSKPEDVERLLEYADTLMYRNKSL